MIDDVSAQAVLRQVRSLRPRHLPVCVLFRDPDLDRMAEPTGGLGARARRRAVRRGGGGRDHPVARTAGARPQDGRRAGAARPAAPDHARGDQPLSTDQGAAPAVSGGAGAPASSPPLAFVLPPRDRPDDGGGQRRGRRSTATGTTMFDPSTRRSCRTRCFASLLAMCATMPPMRAQQVHPPPQRQQRRHARTAARARSDPDRSPARSPSSRSTASTRTRPGRRTSRPPSRASCSSVTPNARALRFARGMNRQNSTTAASDQHRGPARRSRRARRSIAVS